MSKSKKKHVKNFKQIVFLWITICFSICISKLHAQVDHIDTVANNLLNKAKVLSNAGMLQNSDSLLQIASKRYLEQKIWDKWSVSIIRMNSNGKSLRRYRANIQRLQNQLDLLPKDSLYIKSKFYQLIGTNYQLLGENAAAIKYYKESDHLLKKCPDHNKKDKLYNRYAKNNYKQLANCYSKIEDQPSALKYLELYSAFKSNSREKCDYYHLKGRYNLYLEALDTAEFFLLKASRECLDFEASRLLIDLMVNQNRILEAEKILTTIPQKNKVSFHKSFATIARAKGEYNTALHQQQLVVSILENNADNGWRKVNRERMILAHIYEEAGDLKRAAEIAHKSINTTITDKPSDIYIRPKMNSTIPDIWIIEALNIKAKYFSSQHILLGKPKDLAEAKYYYQALCINLDLLKNQYYSNTSKYRMSAYAQSMYYDIVRFYRDLYKENESIEFLNHAFKFSQYANSFNLKNAVSERKALELIGLSQDSTERYLDLVDRVAHNSNEDSISIIFSLDQMRRELGNKYPLFESYRASNEIGVRSIQERINDTTAVLKYISLDSDLLIFVITKKSAQLLSRERPKGFHRLIEEYKSQSSDASGFDEDAYIDISHRLYQILLEDIIEIKKGTTYTNLIIIPNKELANLPFATLLTNNSKPLRAENYLLWNKSISYLYYASQLLYNVTTNETQSEFIGFGLEYEDQFLSKIKSDYGIRGERANTELLTLRPLRYAVEEVVTNAQLFKSSVFLNEQATKSNALMQLGTSTLFHISAHAIVDNTDFLSSYIVLNSPNDEDYRMTYQDIIGSNLRSKLVVLSACQTTVGEEVEGEGNMSLSRAFIHGGAQSIMGSHWNVADRTTKDLMGLFYSNLKKGYTRAASLQLAQKTYLTDDNMSSPQVRTPYYWASWSIYGFDDPIYLKTKSSTKKWYLTFIILGSCFFIYLLLSKRAFRPTKA